jgi:hypothetical protein
MEREKKEKETERAEEMTYSLVIGINAFTVK